MTDFTILWRKQMTRVKITVLMQVKDKKHTARPAFTG